MDTTNKAIIQVERAISDLKRSVPVIIVSGTNAILILAAENCSKNQIKSLIKSTGSKARLVLSSNRIKNLFKKSINTSLATIELNNELLNYIDILSGADLSTSKLPAISEKTIKAASKLDQPAVELLKISELLPACIAFTLPKNYSDIAFYLTIKPLEINQFQDLTAQTLKEICRTPLVLENAKKSEIVAFRSAGGREHYAIIIGKPGTLPLVRIHSSCYTGDLLASLSCDCRDQLHEAIKLMGKSGGGIILYMMQEGRGIGLINKLRAYALKNRGFDTVDANEILGFDHDERLFKPAAEILKKLKIRTINLLTNNPRKAKGLKEFGIKVNSCVPHIVGSNIHNKKYLKSKKERLGHIL